MVRSVFFLANIFFLLILFNVEGKSSSIRSEIEKLNALYKDKIDLSLVALSLKNEQVIYMQNEEALVSPLSMTKFFVAGALLDLLGPNYQFETSIDALSPIESGIVKGGVVLKPSADPSFKSHDLEQLIIALRGKQIKEIQGDFIVDVSEFDDLKFVPSWFLSKKSKLQPPIDAIAVNEGEAVFQIRAAEVAMMSPYVEINVIPGYLHIENKAIMAKIDFLQNDIRVNLKKTGDRQKGIIEGVMSLHSKPLKFRIPIMDTRALLGLEIAYLLKKHQIKHEGRVIFSHKEGGSFELASHHSKPLYDLIKVMLKEDLDFYANMFLKKGGRIRFGKPGSWPSGSQVIRESIYKILGEKQRPLVIVDGSGTSMINKLTPKTLGNYLLHLQKRSDFAPELVSCMPQAGLDGCLRKRFCIKSLSGKFRGFSSFCDKESLLSGYLKCSDGNQIALIISLKTKKDLDEHIYKDLEDKVCEIFYRHTAE